MKHPIIKQILVSLMLLVLCVSTSRAQTNIPNGTVQRIEGYILELEKIGFDGSVLIELGDEKIISKAYGFSDKEKQIKNTPTTIFDIGSITKQFTAAAIVKLEMQGKLSTEDKMSKYLENIPEDKKEITIHDLLRHQSELISNVGKDYEKIVREEFLTKVLSSDLRFKVGSDFSYSNVGYSLLAMIIEKASGETYEGILSTSEDLYKWHKALITDEILSKEAKQKLYHPKLRAEETKASYYAYGWDVSETNRGTTRLWHNGGNNIVYADFLRYIDEGTTMIMLSNKSHPHFDKLNQEVSKLIFDPEYIPVIPAVDNEINRDFTSHIIKTIQDFGLEKARIEYQKKDNQQVIEFIMRGEGLNHLYGGKPEIAMEIFKMNVFAHPTTAKALQSLGEGYMETGNKELALQYFNESLNIDPDNPFASEMIKKLAE